MGTCNFAFDNVLVAIDTDDWDDYMYDDFIDNVRTNIELKIKDGYGLDEYDNNSLHSYGGRFIFGIDVYGALGCYKTIKVVVRNGYYSGLNLDYIISDLVDYEDERKTLEHKVEVMSRKIAKVLRCYGTELRHVATFSNGEALYEKK